MPNWSSSMEQTYEFYEVEPVKDSNWSDSDRNLIIRTDELIDTYVHADGEVRACGSNYKSATMVNPIKINAGHKYVFSKNESSSGLFFRWAWYDKDMKVIGRTANDANSFSWTAPANTVYLIISYPYTNGANPKLTSCVVDGWIDKKLINTVKTCSISRDSEADTLGSATFDVTDSIKECYIRVYLKTIQNGVTERHSLGVFLAQTPSSSFDGKTKSISADAYTPLIELKEKSPPIGYYIPKDSDIMAYAYNLMNENMRGPISRPAIPSTKLSNNFVADTNDTWLSFLTDLVSAASTTTYYKVECNDNGNFIRTSEVITIPESDTIQLSAKTVSNDIVYKYTDVVGDERYYCSVENIIKYKLDLDETGRVLFVPNQDITSLSPVWTYTDDNSSILYPDISMDHDLYGIPNVVEVVYADSDAYLVSRIVNDDPNSPVSTVIRGREIVHRVINPDIHGKPTQQTVDKFAEDLLSALSSVEYTVSYTHGYCPVRVGDCVRLNYTRAGLTNIKAKVISQNIRCETGCSVSEKAVFTSKLWR